MHPLGQTRTSVQRNHAFIAPDSHVTGPLLGWEKTQGTILISPRMGANFSQYLATMEAGGQAGQPLFGVERFVYLLSGTVEFSGGGQNHTLSTGSYAYIPPYQPHTLSATEASQFVIFEKKYVALDRASQPWVVVGQAQEVTGEPFMGDTMTNLKTLLPTDAPFDMAVNLFHFDAGACLPFVEVHIMEHGLYLVEGQGVYRLDDTWYPIQAGDTIWMGPYCPQWFTAIGHTPSAYLYYKDVNRDPLEVA